ncbi:MAG TPA: hypothetical protein VFQ44_14270 [Streptosporangiaceae bacterium]|nr:hypothetical protein [Streptosporangiaceae bacterium]
MVAIAFGFIGIAIVLSAAAVLGLLGIGQIALSGSDALERDGLARGQRAPTWALADVSGLTWISPPASSLQLIMFADHSLKSFPSVVAGLRALRTRADLEIVILTRRLSPGAAGVLGQLGLGGIPVLTGSPATYADYNVRVMPFAIFVDSAGIVRASSLVNHDWQVARLSQVAAIPVEADEPALIPPRSVRTVV